MQAQGAGHAAPDFRRVFKMDKMRIPNSKTHSYTTEKPMNDRWSTYSADCPEEAARWGLLSLMTGISEGFWCASWLTGLEFALWEAIDGGERRYGMAALTDRHVSLLRLLSEEAGGWWTWDDEAGGPTFMSLDSWQAKLHALQTNTQQ